MRECGGAGCDDDDDDNEEDENNVDSDIQPRTGDGGGKGWRLANIDPPDTDLRTLLNDMRSQSTWYTSAPNALRLARAASEREEGRLRQMIRALCRAAIIASVYPVPVVQPVMAIVLNCIW